MKLSAKDAVQIYAERKAAKDARLHQERCERAHAVRTELLYVFETVGRADDTITFEFDGRQFTAKEVD